MAFLTQKQLEEAGLPTASPYKATVRSDGLADIPKRPESACKVYGSWHNYGPLVVLDSNTVLLACACGDVQWKERPKNA